MTFDEWLAYGQERGWAGEEYCATHDMAPLTEFEETLEWDDPCTLSVRIFADLPD